MLKIHGGAAPLPSPDVLASFFPLAKPEFSAPHPATAGEMRVTWIGHSTFVVETAGAVIITDPVFSERCSPVQWAGPKRIVRTPCEVRDLPKVDVVVISHNHYDHLDFASVTALRDHSDPLFVVPLGLKAWFVKHSMPRCVELDWYGSHSLAPHLPIVIHATPVMHWSNRGVDRDQSLWCSYMISRLGVRFGDKRGIFQ